MLYSLHFSSAIENLITTASTFQHDRELGCVSESIAINPFTNETHGNNSLPGEARTDVSGFSFKETHLET